VPWNRFLFVEGGQWDGLWDAQTNVPLAITGSGIPAPGTVASAAEAQRFVEAFLAKHVGLLAPGSAASDIHLVDNISDGEMRTVGLVQTYQGMQVLGANLIFEFKNDRLFVVGSTALPNVKVPVAHAAAKAPDASAVAVASLADAGKNLVAKVPEQAAILPLVRESGAIEFRKVLGVEVTEADGFGNWTVYVDPTSGASVAREDNVRYASGVLKYHIPQRSPLYGMRTDVPAALVNTTVDGMMIKTDNYGLLTWPGSDTASVTTRAVGTLASVNNTTAAGTKITGTVMIAPDGVGVWDRSTVEFDDAQLITYISVNVVKQHVARFVPRGQIAWLNNSVTVNANQNQTCNANWNGTSLQFFRAGASMTGNMMCENTGRITDVVYHEFGHGFHQNVVTGGGRTDGSMGEGVGDTMGFTITNDSQTGRGFFTTDAMNGIRDADDMDRKWPPPAGQDVHTTGIIYSGFQWDMRKNLAAMHGEREGHWQHERLFYEGTRRATNIPTSYTQTVAADDDDGNLMNGTPHICAINEAGARHNLAMRTGANLIPWVAPPELTGQHLTVKLVGNDLCPMPVDLMSASADYQPRDGMTPTTVMLTKDAMGNYAGDLPSPGENKVGQYKVTATFANGKTYTYPDNPADPMYEFYTGTVTKLYCTSFDDATEPMGWTHTAMPATADEWEWGPPGQIAGTNDPRSAFSGNNVYGMDLGKWTTDGVYAPSATTSLTSPSIPTMGMKVVRLQYRRQLNVEMGSNDQATIYANDTKVWSNNATMNHVDKEWRFHDVDISAQATGGMVQIKFEIVSNGSNNYGGWNVDDFCVIGVTGSAPPDAGPDGSRTDGGPGSDGGTTGIGGSPGTTTGMTSGTGGDGTGGGSGGSTTGAGGGAGAGGSRTTSGPSTGTGNLQPPGSGDDGGCSCRTVSSRAPSASWLLLIAFEGIRRGRRRRRCA
jgi:hypothetical protein